jgi:hypothetical protein
LQKVLRRRRFSSVCFVVCEEQDGGDVTGDEYSAQIVQNIWNKEILICTLAYLILT